MDIHPTHECFDDVNDILKDLAIHNRIDELLRLRVVHAVCRMPKDGKLYAHAWIEIDNSCWFKGIIDGETVTLSASPVSDFHDHYQVQEYKKYSISDLRAFGGRYPPYEEPFISLCKQ